MTENTSLPVFLVVDEDSSTLDSLVSDLKRRFAADYRMVGESSPGAALERLGALYEAGGQVALIICRESMQASGSELLARSRSTYPDAKRILLIGYGEQGMFDVVAQGMARGNVEYYVPRPWRPPGHVLYPVVGEALAAWTRRHTPGFQLVRIVGDRWHPRSYEIRDAMERNNIPYGFYDRDSPAGAELLSQLDEVPDDPVVFMADGRILTEPTAADIAAAVGARIHPKRRPTTWSSSGRGRPG